LGPEQASEGPMKVLIYVNTSKEVGDWPAPGSVDNRLSWDWWFTLVYHRSGMIFAEP